MVEFEHFMGVFLIQKGSMDVTGAQTPHLTLMLLFG
jgi:hypothetical protein